MIESTWTSAVAESPSGRTAQTIERLWNAHVAVRLHRALDAALRAGELRTLDADTLADIGYRRG